MQEAVGTGDWEQFKKKLYALYPGSTHERKYSVANLVSLVEKQATVNIANAEEFGAYSRSFQMVASFLKSKGHLSDREISRYFMQGLDLTFLTKVQEQLRAENPRHHSDDPYKLAEISAAALFILSCTLNNEGQIVLPNGKWIRTFWERYHGEAR